jgi:hypothetical protein
MAVAFSRGAAKRIAAVVRAAESGTGTRGITWWPYREGGSAGGSRIVLGTIAAPWAKGTNALVTQTKGDGTAISPAKTLTARNWFAEVKVPSGTKRVAVAKVDGYWILIAAEC